MLARTLVSLLIVGIVGAPLLYRVSQDRRYRNLHVVEEGRLYRSGQLTPEGFERVLRELRVGTVVSMRETKNEKQEFQDGFEEEICRRLGVRYERFGYLDWSAPDGTMPAMANIRKFLQLFDDRDSPKPVLVHCFAGIHRTGVHVAAYRVDQNGWTNAEAMAELRWMGTRRTTFADNLVEFVHALKPRAVGGARPER
ncbi:MAG: tyrosine-protein phosphatase [Gemmataceae bacterium]|nr:tyrosine-protein phosphatase [Gemmataceae bacterium]